MTAADVSTWTQRYRDALEPGVIRERAEVRGAVKQDLSGMQIEVACNALELGLRAVHLVNAQAEAIVRAEIERALAHAIRVYSEPGAVLRAVYGEMDPVDPYMPTLVTGPAGVGKSRLLLTMRRVLFGNRQISIDASHAEVPLRDYSECVIGEQQSVAAVLRPLASPEVARGRVRVKQGDMPWECARWQHISGVCSLGVDELQFMAQSENATTLITRTLLALGNIRIPWFFCANYSLCWKLLARPQEALQRLLSRPVVVLPDPPDSDDWSALLAEYQIVLRDAIECELKDHRVELWNLCAGLKRELVKLLVHGYRTARHSGQVKMSWTHVKRAFESLEFSIPRQDINLLIAHAGQGGKLRKDLSCPFSGPELISRRAAYEQQLRSAREGQVAKASVASAMNAEERRAFEKIEKSSKPAETAPAQVIPFKRGKRQSFEELFEAAQRKRESLGRVPQT